jgi:hypothetical protein
MNKVKLSLALAALVVIAIFLIYYFVIRKKDATTISMPGAAPVAAATATGAAGKAATLSHVAAPGTAPASLGTAPASLGTAAASLGTTATSPGTTATSPGTVAAKAATNRASALPVASGATSLHVASGATSSHVAAARAAATAGNAGSSATTPQGPKVPIAAVSTVDPVLAKQILKHRLTKAKTAANNLYTAIGSLIRDTSISAANKKKFEAAPTPSQANLISWLSNTNANVVDSLSYQMTNLSFVLSSVISDCSPTGSPTNPFGTSCGSNPTLVANATAAYNLIGQINSEAITFAKTLGMTTNNGQYQLNSSCSPNKICGYLVDINNVITSGTTHPPNIWTLVKEAKSIVSGSNKLISLLTKLVSSTSWINQVTPYSLTMNMGNRNMVLPLPNFATGPSKEYNNLSWYNYFLKFMSNYIGGMKAMINDVNSTSHSLGTFSGYYNQL